MKLKAMKTNNQTGIVHILPFEFVAIVTQGILKLDLAANVPRQPYNTRPLSKIFFSVLQLQRYKVKVFYYRHYKARDL